MADWAIEFDSAPHENNDWSLPVVLDWPSFHERGIALGRRLKAEVGAIRVIYSKPVEDPDSETNSQFEIMAGGILRALPDWLGPPFRLCKTIISGGQTGTDRAALDFAIAENCPHGGWCPQGRTAEDGSIPERYRLVETESDGYHQRTSRNVVESDGTLILNLGELSDGTRETQRIAEREGKPNFVVAMDEALEPQFGAVLTWLGQHPMPRLNIAGPRESKRPGAYRRAFNFLTGLVEQPYIGALKGIERS